jgi:hypothetical protein
MKKYFALYILVCFAMSSVIGQSAYTGRQYLGEGIPLRWFKLETDTSGHYYFKGDVGYSELQKSPLIWKHTSDSVIQLLVYYESIPDTFNLRICLDGHEYCQSTDLFDVFHRKHTIELDGKIYKE